MAFILELVSTGGEKRRRGMTVDGDRRSMCGVVVVVYCMPAPKMTICAKMTFCAKNDVLRL
jgi:hypothetical protein